MYTHITQNVLFRVVVNRSFESAKNRAERVMRQILAFWKISAVSRLIIGTKKFARAYSVLESFRKKRKYP